MATLLRAAACCGAAPLRPPTGVAVASAAVAWGGSGAATGAGISAANGGRAAAAAAIRWRLGAAAAAASHLADGGRHAVPAFRCTGGAAAASAAEEEAPRAAADVGLPPLPPLLRPRPAAPWLLGCRGGGERCGGAGLGGGLGGGLAPRRTSLLALSSSLPPPPSPLRPKFLLQGTRAIHKFAKPDSPNLDNLRRVMTEKLIPVHFFLKNHMKFTNWVWDMHFKGICCSPKFEGKSYKEMNAMVNACAREVGMEGRVQVRCEPPSRWFKMRRIARKRWHIDM